MNDRQFLDFVGDKDAKEKPPMSELLKFTNMVVTQMIIKTGGCSTCPGIIHDIWEKTSF